MPSNWQTESRRYRLASDSWQARVPQGPTARQLSMTWKHYGDWLLYGSGIDDRPFPPVHFVRCLLILTSVRGHLIVQSQIVGRWGPFRLDSRVASRRLPRQLRDVDRHVNVFHYCSIVERDSRFRRYGEIDSSIASHLPWQIGKSARLRVSFIQFAVRRCFM